MHTWTYTCIHAFTYTCTHTTHMRTQRNTHTTQKCEETLIFLNVCLFWGRFSHRTSRSEIHDSWVLGLQGVIWSGLESFSLARKTVWALESCGKCEVQRRWVSHKCLRISEWSNHSNWSWAWSMLSTAGGHSLSFSSSPSHCCHHRIILQNSFDCTCSPSLSSSICLS